MTYTITKNVSEKRDDDHVEVIQLVKLTTAHAALDEKAARYTRADTFLYQSGYVQLDEQTRVEITRILLSCDEGHDHGVYYQAPRQMELWEAMFAIGETPADLIKFEDGDDK